MARKLKQDPAISNLAQSITRLLTLEEQRAKLDEAILNERRVVLLDRAAWREARRDV